MDIWTQYVLPIISGISLSAVITTVVGIALKGLISRAIRKINVTKICEDVNNKTLDRIKGVTFKHSIEPLVKSELEKVREEATEIMKAEVEELKAQNQNLINILEKLSAYFDNSVGIAPEKKEELKEAIEQAKEQPQTAETVVVEETITKEEKPVKEPKKTKKSDVLL